MSVDDDVKHGVLAPLVRRFSTPHGSYRLGPVVSAHFECSEAFCAALEQRLGLDEAAASTVVPFRVPVESPR